MFPLAPSLEVSDGHALWWSTTKAETSKAQKELKGLGSREAGITALGRGTVRQVPAVRFEAKQVPLRKAVSCSRGWSNFKRSLFSKGIIRCAASVHVSATDGQACLAVAMLVFVLRLKLEISNLNCHNPQAHPTLDLKTE